MAKNAPSSIRANVQSVSDAFDIYAQGKKPPAYRAGEFKTASDNLNKFAEGQMQHQAHAAHHVTIRGR